jgi:hypothetical protein
MLHSHIIIFFFFVIYFLIAFCFFNLWLDFFLDDKEMSSEQRYFSSIVLVLGSALWPIVIPIAYVELLKLHKKNKMIINLLTSLSNDSISE